METLHLSEPASFPEPHVGPGSGCNAPRSSRGAGRTGGGHRSPAWDKVVGCNKARGMAAEAVSNRCPHAPARLCSSWPPPMLGLPPPSFPPLTLAVASSGPVKSVMPQNTWLPSHTLPNTPTAAPPPPEPLLTLEKGRSLGASGHPLTAPLRSSPRPHQASHRPTRAVKFTGWGWQIG